MKGELTRDDSDKCYRILNILALVSFAADALENSPDDRPGAVMAGVRKCTGIAQELVGEVIDTLDLHLREARS
jgi:hypothetical protein